MQMLLQIGKICRYGLRSLCCRWALGTTWLAVYVGEEVKPLTSSQQRYRHWSIGTETGTLGIVYNQAMRAQTWERFWRTSKQASWCSWTAGASRWSQMTLRRKETRCPMRSSTTTFPLEWWAAAWMFLIPNQRSSYSNYTCVHVSRTPQSLIVSIPWERNTPRDSTAGERSD